MLMEQYFVLDGFPEVKLSEGRAEFMVSKVTDADTGRKIEGRVFAHYQPCFDRQMSVP